MAVWIALSAVFIALIPVFVISARAKAAKKENGSGDAGTSTTTGTDVSDCGSDGGGGD